MITIFKPGPEHESIRVQLFEEMFEDRMDLYEFLREYNLGYGDVVEIEVYYYMYGEDDVDLVDFKFENKSVWLQLSDDYIREEFADQYWRLFSEEK